MTDGISPQDETAALLRSLTLNPEFQGKGIAKEMMIQLPSGKKTVS